MNQFILRPKGYTRWRLRTRLFAWHHLGHPFTVKDHPGGTLIDCRRCGCMVAAMVGAGFHLDLRCNECGRAFEFRPAHLARAKYVVECECGMVTTLNERKP